MTRRRDYCLMTPHFLIVFMSHEATEPERSAAEHEKLRFLHESTVVNCSGTLLAFQFIGWFFVGLNLERKFISVKDRMVHALLYEILYSFETMEL